MLGFKLFNSDPIELINELILLAHEDNLALEIALYKDNSDEFINKVIQNPFYTQNKNKSIHFNYNKHVVNNLKEEKHYKNLLTEIVQAKKLLINKGVIHYQYAGNTKTHLENLTYDALKHNLVLLYEIAKEHNVFFYIENTFIYKRHYFMNKLEHHKIIWDTVLKLGFEDYIGICLDWGHVKAFSKDSLTSWIDYAKDLKQKGMSIYMHIHDNDSLKDLHLSLKESYDGKYYLNNHPDDKPYIYILNDIFNSFKDNILILEYKSDIAKEHYFWTKSKIINYFQ